MEVCCQLGRKMSETLVVITSQSATVWFGVNLAFSGAALLLSQSRIYYPQTFQFIWLHGTIETDRQTDRDSQETPLINPPESIKPIKKSDFFCHPSFPFSLFVQLFYFFLVGGSSAPAEIMRIGPLIPIITTCFPVSMIHVMPVRLAFTTFVVTLHVALNMVSTTLTPFVMKPAPGLGLLLR